MTVRASSPRTILTESSTSTIATDHSDTSPAARSDESTSTEMSGHSIVRGFAPGGAPSTYRSRTQLAPQPTPILKTSIHHRPDPSKKKGPMFTLGGGSSTKEENSFPDSGASKVADRFAKRVSSGKKHPSFKDEIENIRSSVVENENPFESDSEDDEEDISESAIDDDEENDEGWEDEDSEEESSEPDDKTLFQRIDSRPNLVSRKSLLSLMLHEPDRAKALQNAASRSMPAMRRSRTSSPNGPSMASSPQEGLALDIPRSKPIVVTTSNTYQPASSPRTTRRNMLSTELTESLRKHLLWERQQRNVTSYAALKRRHTSHDVKDLTHYPGERPEATMASKEASKNNSWNHYFDHGLLDYHQSGW
ncbi:hypothetical protein LTR39_001715 [Cryomyces antarcticus]|nr:hypothetical protein LTR39_001715 [Cryomyces antarcticus]